MYLKSISKPKKSLKIDYLNKIVSPTITNKPQLIGLNYCNKNNSLQCWVIQPSLCATWHNSKSLTPDVETVLTNGYMNKLIKILNIYHKLSQKFKCDLSYSPSLSKLRLQSFTCGCLKQSQQCFLQQLRAFMSSLYQRYKINFAITEAI